MRPLLLVGFFICIGLHFLTRKGEVPHDSQASHSSISQKKEIRKVAKAPVEHIEQKIVTVASVERPVLSAPVEREEVTEDYVSDDEINALPWDDIEEGWKHQLKEFLISMDPERGEEMFAAYLEEKKKYVDRIDFKDTEYGVSAEADTDSLIEYDAQYEGLEVRHRENLQEIFGDYFSQVEALHSEYVDSIQYLNRTTTKISFSL